MKMEDLKSGMMIVTNEGQVGLIVRDTIQGTDMVIYKGGWDRLEIFSFCKEAPQYRIVKVLGGSGWCWKPEYRTVLYDAEVASKQMTVEEVEKELGYKVEIVS